MGIYPTEEEQEERLAQSKTTGVRGELTLIHERSLSSQRYEREQVIDQRP
jgi:hypothetical protein